MKEEKKEKIEIFNAKLDRTVTYETTNKVIDLSFILKEISGNCEKSYFSKILLTVNSNFPTLKDLEKTGCMSSTAWSWLKDHDYVRETITEPEKIYRIGNAFRDDIGVYVLVQTDSNKIQAIGISKDDANRKNDKILSSEKGCYHMTSEEVETILPDIEYMDKGYLQFVEDK